MSALAEAFNRAGLHPRDVAFDVALTKYINSGGTFASARERIDAAERMSGMGRDELACESQSSHAQTRQPVEGGLAEEAMRSAAPLLPCQPPSSNRGGGGQMTVAPQRPLDASVPVREPSQAQRTVAGIIAKASAVTVLDTLKIDGRSIGDWTVAEARAVGRTKTREGRILIEASRVVANAPSNALIRDVIKATELQMIMQKAAEISDAT